MLSPFSMIRPGIQWEQGMWEWFGMEGPQSPARLTLGLGIGAPTAGIQLPSPGSRMPQLEFSSQHLDFRLTPGFKVPNPGSRLPNLDLRSQS